MKIQGRMTRGLPGTLASTIIVGVAGACAGIMLARTLGPERRGEMAAVIVWLNALTLIGNLGLGFSFAYFAGKEPKRIGGLWLLSWLVSILWGGLLALFGALILPEALHLSPVVSSYLRWMAVAIPFMIATNQQAHLLLGSNALVEFNLLRIYGGVSYTIGVACVAAMGWPTVRNYLIAYLCTQTSACMITSSAVIWRLRPVFAWPRTLVRPVFAYGLKSFLSSIASQVNLRMDQLIMTSVMASDQLGLYAVAVSLSGMLAPLYNALAMVVFPRIAKAENIEAGGGQALRHIYLAALLGVPTTVLAILLMPWVLPFLFSKDYSGAIFPARILLVAALFQGVNSVLGNSLRGLGEPGKPALSEGLGLVVTVALLALLLPPLGILGAAIASLCAYFVVALAQVAFFRQAVGLSWRELATPRWQVLVPNNKIFGMRFDFASNRIRRLLGLPVAE
ncbi:MAG: oligosaccharide flippase family protein [Elusimicrobia bacterium]|nr:oligosaccharide flippase family protein [Elusimicrobiota bacterium]